MKVPCVLYWWFGLFSLLLPLLRYPSPLRVKNCSSLHLFCSDFSAIPFKSPFSLYPTKFRLLFFIFFIFVIIFSVLPYLFPLILYVPVFSTHISHFLRERQKKCASVFELCCIVHIQFSSLYDAEIVGRDSSTLQYLIK